VLERTRFANRWPPASTATIGGLLLLRLRVSSCCVYGSPASPDAAHVKCRIDHNRRRFVTLTLHRIRSRFLWGRSAVVRQVFSPPPD
jgi:hypothetical protein